MTAAPLRTPLYDTHIAAGARMVPFAGYDMPVQYSGGIIQEHRHTRAAASIFDVSHMGQISLRCPLPELARLLPGDLAVLAPGQSLYSLLLNSEGGVIDDLIVTRLDAGGENWFFVVNASRKHEDVAHLRAALPDAFIDMHDDRALIALQGPQAAAVMARYSAEAAALRFMHGGAYDLPGAGRAFVIRSGYTGEDGFEIALAADAATGFWTRLAAEPEIAPAGLGARDTLRLEAGLCLYGHELDETTSPVEAVLAWTIPPARRAAADFPGAGRILRELRDGTSRRRAGLLLEGKALARDGMTVESEEGRNIGIVTSGGFSPSLDAAIAMAYLETAHAKTGETVYISLRGRRAVAKIVKLPFVPHRYVRDK